MIKRGVILVGFILSVLLLSNFIIAEDVAYLYKSKTSIDKNVVNVFTSLNLSVDYIQDDNISNLSGYKIVYVGDERFRANLDIYNYPTIFSNYYLGVKEGLTDKDGISKLVSTKPLSVNFKGQHIQVYNSSKDKNQFISYYYLDILNKAHSLKRYAGVLPSSPSQNFGDVISFVGRGERLNNGQITQNRICFFGIIESDYWTPEAQKLFKSCMNFVANIDTSETIICSSNAECDDEINSTIDTCINAGTQESFCKNIEVECTLNLDCGIETSSQTCSGNNLTSVKTTPTCSQNMCSSIQESIIKTCEFGCNSTTNECFPKVTCSSNNDCNDNNETTIDLCNNNGTQESTCSHTSSIPLIISLGGNSTQTSIIINIIVNNSTALNGYYISENKTNETFVEQSVDNFKKTNLSQNTTYTFFVRVENILNQSSPYENISITTLSNSSSDNSGGGSSSGSGGGSSSGSGGGGGGSSTSSDRGFNIIINPPDKDNGKCKAFWTCTEWSLCINSKQTRECTSPPNTCKPEQPQPVIEQSCGLNNSISTQPVANQGGLRSLITGAFLGNNGTPTPLFWSSLALVIFGIGTYYYRKKIM